MTGKRYRVLLIILTGVVFLMALAAELVFFSDFEYRVRTRMFNRTLSAKEKLMEDCLNAMKPILASKNHHGSNEENNLFSLAEQNRITILEYLDNKLVYWSDNGFEVPLMLEDSLYRKPLIFLQNGWFLTKTVQAGNEKIVGLLRLHADYGFENEIIKSGFEKDFGLNGNVGFSTDKNSSRFHVFTKEGDYLFSLRFPEVKENSYFILIPICLYIFLFVLIILLALELVRYLVSKGRKQLAVVLSFLFFSVLYFLMLFSGKPYVFFRTDLFLPYRFAINNIIPSLGHFLIIGVFTACFSVIFFRHYQFPEFRRGKRLNDYIVLTGLLISGIFLFTVCDFVFRELVLNSNISFETYKVLNLSVASFAGFVSVILIMVLPVAFVLKIFQAVKQFRSLTIIFSILTSLLLPVIVYYNYPEKFIPLVLLFIVISGVIRISGIKKAGIFNMTLIFSLIFGFYTLFQITVLSEQNRKEELKIQAVSFSTENDPEAEHLLLDLWPVINSDTTLAGMMKVEYFGKTDFDRISEYLQDKYFTGYWRNFNFSIVPCSNDEPLQIGSGNDVKENCFSFFEERIRLNGHKLTGTEFYFIDNQGGRSYYVGKLYFKSNNGIKNGLFIELYSDINVFQAGYSELLLDKKFHGYAALKDYSFAKYINGEIVLRIGEFPYDKTDTEYVEEDSEYKFFEKDGYKHILYKNGNATILISRPKLTFEDIIISFAYLFAFILLFFNLILLFVRRPDMKNVLVFNFRQKLQLSFLGVLFFSFILIGAVVTSFIIRQYQTRHNENLKEKLNSIYLELESKIGDEKNLSLDWRSSSYSSLNELLIKLSNVFMTDINLYDKYGFLIATSRPEIFYRDLTSQRIDNIAFNNLKVLTKSEYSQKEKIGSLQYISTYVPFFSNDNRVLAYLNLPYFRAQSILAKEISNLAVAVINFTILLIVITTGLVVFISGRLTSPLTMLGEGLATVGVGKKSEHLSYKGKDEIGELVKQYNRMVDEIEDSSNKLANSEREYAWREMAKQIAHEIKNPLTPMKLNVQHLFKSWNDKAPGFAKKLERFTKNQIEYIDNLSSIASAFSSFAKMPGTNRIEIDLLDQIKTTLELFKSTDNVIFLPHWPHESKIVIYADKEQLNGIFSNLFKNGIQSIPPWRQGVIDINFQISGDKVIIAISDNGTGIPEDLKKKLFTPNFTTKSSGMGLGLSIVKKYIESANGRIWFESKPEKGSVFYVELPILHTVERPG